MYHYASRHRISILLSVAIALMVAVTNFAARETVPAAAPHVHSSHEQAAAKAVPPGLQVVHRETGPFIDGAERPDLIPDAAGYALFLRMLLPGNTSDAQIRQRAYIKHVLRGAAAVERGPAAAEVVPTDEGISNVLRFVASYEARLKDVDAGGLATRSAATPLIHGIVATMPKYLGGRLAHEVDRYVKEQFKRKIKIIQ